MSHKKDFEQGKISRNEYDNAEYLKKSGQTGLYKLYEERLKQGIKEREHNAQMIQDQAAQHKGRLTLSGHILRAERTN